MEHGIPLETAQSAMTDILEKYGLNITKENYIPERPFVVGKHRYILELKDPLSGIRLHGDKKIVESIEIFSRIPGQISRNYPDLLETYKEELEKIGLVPMDNWVSHATLSLKSCNPKEATGKELTSFLDDVCSLTVELQKAYNKE